MKLRVKQTCNIDGECVYFPQYKRWFIWFNFWDFTEMPPKCIKFYNLQSAKLYVLRQADKPKDKIHKIN
jgi:hypothetical protein